MASRILVLAALLAFAPVIFLNHGCAVPEAVKSALMGLLSSLPTSQSTSSQTTSTAQTVQPGTVSSPPSVVVTSSLVQPITVPVPAPVTPGTFGFKEAPSK